MTITDSTTGDVRQDETGGQPVPHVRVAIIGAGFSGLGLAIRLLKSEEDDFLIFERAGQVGGTWRDNTYPGAECDVAALLYSYSYAQRSDWQSTYGKQPELYAYLNDCADRFGVRPHIRFHHELLSARWDETVRRWHLETSQGDYTAQVLVTGSGYLSDPVIPDIPGLADFGGTVFHSSRWDHDFDLSGKRVAVIGSGASALQFVPKIQPEVGRMDLYQRTPAWIAPKNDKPNGRFRQWLFRNIPGYRGFRRGYNQWGREVLAFLLGRPKIAAKSVQGMFVKHLTKSVPDPELRAKLTPDFTIGCKRMLFSNTYYPAIQQPNVELVTDSIVRVQGNSVVTADGREREVDAIILGTGFHATDRPIARRVWNDRGDSLARTWAADGMTAYRGTTVSGFPNLFMLLGPNTTLGHSSQTVMIEAQVAYIVDALDQMDKRGLASVSVHEDAQTAYNETVQRKLSTTVWNAGQCASWYLDEHGRNPSIWPSFTWKFRKQLKRFDLSAYQVTTISGIEHVGRAAGIRS
ncbi:flavin-containing monooxygenase [Actinophytocola gossypii]|uniref:NAD(P)/FAD-dependent oxidoreductase n=1 Tax=Actinophytocola gossypii TaxID=2812003 RepID=A0ABT2J3T1_9PSEU|nr:NAD(P)/FAD-dependent oxidoreductase [Actinophytocola gossypii]MCT2581964.1 NAD(P)/FAD-dependent oxidoreductase [Actinophytocola gossypii]